MTPIADHRSDDMPVEHAPMPGFELTLEEPLALAKRDEVVLLRAALARNPGSMQLRGRLALVLLADEAFEEAIALIEQLIAHEPRHILYRHLADAYLSREGEGDAARAEAAARAAVAHAPADRHLGIALAALAKAQTRQGRSDDARNTLVAALDAAPDNADAFKRLVALHLARDDRDAVLALCDRLSARGVGHSRLLVARALALAGLGRIAAARQAVAFDRFLYSETLTPPRGWETIEAFNAALRIDLENHPDLRFNRIGAASTESWRIDQPAYALSKMVPLLQEEIRQAVLRHAAASAASDHPWTHARPAAAQLHNWCVLTDATGYEEWHVHQHGWMSGVYYVSVPPVVANGDGRGGCIVFGLPDELVGAEMSAAYGERVVRPYSGLLMLFPSHCYHRTFPHGSDDRRICLAFDIQPR